MKKALSVLLATAILLSCFSMGTFVIPVSAAPRVTKMTIAQNDIVLADNGSIGEEYGWFYESVIKERFDYVVTFSDGSKRTLSYYDLEEQGILFDDIIYFGEIYQYDGEYFFAPGKQPVTIYYGSKTFATYVNITTYLEWCSNLHIKSDYDNMYIYYGDHSDQGVHTYYWHIKPDETNLYGFYSADWDQVRTYITVFDKYNRVVKYDYNGCKLKAGNEYCLRVSYSYNDYCYSDVTFHIEPDREHTHKYSAATCTKPRTCKECGNTKGKALGHDYKTVASKQATLTANGKAKNICSDCGYTASKTATIYKASKVSLSTTSYTYNGKVKRPTVIVKDSKGKTIFSKYYTVTYASGRKNVGTYKVTVKFKGNYSGTKTLTFTINPPQTKVAKVTPTKKQLKVYVSRKTSAQATGYQIQYATNKKFTNAKTKWITSYKTGETTLTSLKAKTTYYIRVRTYKKVGGKTYYSGWSTISYKKTK